MKGRGMKASRAGKSGGSWYGSYKVVYMRASGVVVQYDTTNKRSAACAARKLVAGGATWAEVRSDDGDVLFRVPAARVL